MTLLVMVNLTPLSSTPYGMVGGNGSNCATGADFARKGGDEQMASGFLQKEPVDRLMDVTARVMRAESDLPQLIAAIPRMRSDEIVREVAQYHRAVREVHESLKDVTGMVLAMERQISGNYGRTKRAPAALDYTEIGRE